MLNEIDRDFYCSANCHRPDGVCDLSTINEDKGNYTCSLLRSVGKGCQCYHRKHPTPEQFKEEYGFEWEGAYYVLYGDADNWCASDEYISYLPCVCACTPFGRPDNDWRPE